MKTVVFVSLCWITLSSDAQHLEPALWKYKLSEEQVKVGQLVDLIFEVTLLENWYIYATDFTADDFGPLPTTFMFQAHPSYALVGEATSVDSKQKTDDLWGITFRYMDQSPSFFKQRIKVLKADPVIRGHYTYQVCTVLDGKCISGQDEFEFKMATDQ